MNVIAVANPRECRASRSGKIKPEDGSRFVFMLTCMQKVIDSALFEERLQRLEDKNAE